MWPQRWANSLSFELRRRSWGKLKLRLGPPELRDLPAEQVFYQRLLEGAQISAPSSVRRVVDLGCRNWGYLPALLRAFPQAELTGIELDPGRRAWNLHRRADQLDAQVDRAIAGGRKANWLAGDLLEWAPRLRQGKEDLSATLLTFFFPFVSSHPCLRWGLPLKYSRYDPVFAELMAWLKAGASVIVAHQGEWEAQISRPLYQAAGVLALETVITPDLFPKGWPGRHAVHVFRLHFST